MLKLDQKCSLSLYMAPGFLEASDLVVFLSAIFFFSFDLVAEVSMCLANWITSNKFAVANKSTWGANYFGVVVVFLISSFLAEDLAAKAVGVPMVLANDRVLGVSEITTVDCNLEGGVANICFILLLIGAS